MAFDGNVVAFLPLLSHKRDIDSSSCGNRKTQRQFAVRVDGQLTILLIPNMQVF